MVIKYAVSLVVVVVVVVVIAVVEVVLVFVYYNAVKRNVHNVREAS